jgi:cell division protein FtsB
MNNRTLTEPGAVKAMTRAEWIAAGAFVLNIATLVFGLGVVWGDVQDHERRLSAQETKMDTMIPRVERIDANVAFLADQAREARERARK